MNTSDARTSDKTDTQVLERTSSKTLDKSNTKTLDNTIVQTLDCEYDEDAILRDITDGVDYIVDCNVKVDALLTIEAGVTRAC